MSCRSGTSFTWSGWRGTGVIANPVSVAGMSRSAPGETSPCGGGPQSALLDGVSRGATVTLERYSVEPSVVVVVSVIVCVDVTPAFCIGATFTVGAQTWVVEK